MWHDIVSQADGTAQFFLSGAVGLFYRFPFVFTGTVLATMALLSMLCFEIRKSEKLQERSDVDLSRLGRSFDPHW